ncbi:MAG: hypothetical protein GEV08_19790 [Acidimicrobiia bacterium]|nr:hypothetical protein [Acidimicrobiia bacterium]
MKANVSPKLLAALVLLVVALAYLVVLRPQGAALGEARDERQRLEQERAQLERRREQEASAATPAGPELALLGPAVPATPELSNVFRQLNTIAAETGMQQTSVTPSALGGTDSAPGGSMQISLAVTGPANASFAYLQRLATLERLFLVEQFSVQRGAGGDGGNAVQLQLSGRVFTTESPAEPPD